MAKKMLVVLLVSFVGIMGLAMPLGNAQASDNKCFGFHDNGSGIAWLVSNGVMEICNNLDFTVDAEIRYVPTPGTGQSHSDLATLEPNQTLGGIVLYETCGQVDINFWWDGGHVERGWGNDQDCDQAAPIYRDVEECQGKNLVGWTEVSHDSGETWKVVDGSFHIIEKDAAECKTGGDRKETPKKVESQPEGCVFTEDASLAGTYVFARWLQEADEQFAKEWLELGPTTSVMKEDKVTVDYITFKFPANAHGKYGVWFKQANDVDGTMPPMDQPPYKVVDVDLCEQVVARKADKPQTTPYSSVCLNEVILVNDTEGVFNDISRVEGNSLVNVTRDLGPAMDRDANVVDCFKFAVVRDHKLWVVAHDGSVANPVTYKGERIQSENVASNGNGLIGAINSETGQIHVMDAYLPTGKASFMWTIDVNASDFAMAPDGTVAFIENGRLMFASKNGEQIIETPYGVEGGLNFDATGSVLSFKLIDKTYEVNLKSGEVRLLDPSIHYVESDPKMSSDMALIVDGNMTFWSTFTGDFLAVGAQPVSSGDHEITSPDWWVSHYRAETVDTMVLVRQQFEQ